MSFSSADCCSQLITPRHSESLLTFLFICSSIANTPSQILPPEAKPFYSPRRERVVMSGHEDGWRQNLMAPGLRAATQRRLVPQQMRFTAAYASAACPRPRSADPRTEPACGSTYVLHAFPSGAVVHLSVPPGQKKATSVSREERPVNGGGQPLNGIMQAYNHGTTRPSG